MATVTGKGYVTDDPYEFIDNTRGYNEDFGSIDTGSSVINQNTSTYSSNFFPHMQEVFKLRESGPSASDFGDLKQQVLGEGITVDGVVSGGDGFKNPLKGMGQNPAATAGIVRGAAGVMQGLIGREGRRNAQIEAQDAYDDLLTQYRNLDTSNIYADVENFFAENVYEDLTVNKQQAEFEKEMFERQQANIMSNLAGAAGGSGIASLAQAMANQSQIQAQRAAGTIGMQESRNQMLRAQGALQVQKGEMLAEQMRLQGAERARALEYQQTATQLGMSQQDLAAANRAQAQGNAALYGGIGSIAGGIIGGPIGASIGGKLGGMIGGQ